MFMYILIYNVYTIYIYIYIYIYKTLCEISQCDIQYKLAIMRSQAAAERYKGALRENHAMRYNI